MDNMLAPSTGFVEQSTSKSWSLQVQGSERFVYVIMILFIRKVVSVNAVSP
jgi:hypothetical protein